MKKKDIPLWVFKTRGSRGGLCSQYELLKQIRKAKKDEKKLDNRN
jgi:hypothetical protein